MRLHTITTYCLAVGQLRDYEFNTENPKDKEVITFGLKYWTQYIEIISNIHFSKN